MLNHTDSIPIHTHTHARKYPYIFILGADLDRKRFMIEEPFKTTDAIIERKHLNRYLFDSIEDEFYSFFW